VNGDPLTRKRLIALLAGLHGETAKAEAQIQAFEKAIEQPLVIAHGGARQKQGYPGNHENPEVARRGNNVGYLMGRLLKIDPDIQDRIGKGGTVCRVALGVLIGAIPAGLVFHCLLQLVGLITRRSAKPSGRFHAVQD
jgi:hypothetical protein